MTKTEALSEAKKRYNRCLWDTIKLSLGTGLGSALPTPTIEVPKQIAISVTDLGLCFHIYQVFFEEEIKSSDQFMKLLERAGIVTVIGGGIVYVGYKAVRGLLDEVANFAPPFGQILSGAITMTETVAIGLVWADFVKSLYVEEMTNA